MRRDDESRIGRIGVRWTGVAALLLGLLAQGCADDAAAGPGMAHAHESPEALAGAVLNAIAADDAEALKAAMITRDEHRRLVWPQLPESDEIAFDAAWQMNEAASRKARRNVLASFGGTDFELVEIAFQGTPERYEGFTVHFGTELTVRRRSDGREGTLEVLDVVVEREGRWKALNFDDD